MTRTVVVDLDGTICTERPTFERSLAEPLPNAADTLWRLHTTGYRIIIYTARSWAEYAVTEKWLKDYGIMYDVLVCGKPVGDVWIDDRALRFTTWENIHRELCGQK